MSDENETKRAGTDVTVVAVPAADGGPGAVVTVADGTALVVQLDENTEPATVAQGEPVAAVEAPVERDPDLMTLEEARRLINRVRRTSFYLSVTVPAFNPEKPNMYFPAHNLVKVTAAQLFEIIGDMQREGRRTADRLVRVRYDAPKTEWDRGFLVFGGGA